MDHELSKRGPRLESGWVGKPTEVRDLRDPSKRGLVAAKPVSSREEFECRVDKNTYDGEEDAPPGTGRQGSIKTPDPTRFTSSTMPAKRK